MSTDEYVRKIGDGTKKLTEVSNLVGRLSEDVHAGLKEARAEGNEREAAILEEVLLFLSCAGLATEEALSRLTLYGEWIQSGGEYAQMPTEAEVF